MIFALSRIVYRRVHVEFACALLARSECCDWQGFCAVLGVGHFRITPSRHGPIICGNRCPVCLQRGTRRLVLVIFTASVWCSYRKYWPNRVQYCTVATFRNAFWQDISGKKIYRVHSKAHRNKSYAVRVTMYNGFNQIVYIWCCISQFGFIQASYYQCTQKCQEIRENQFQRNFLHCWWPKAKLKTEIYTVAMEQEKMFRSCSICVRGYLIIHKVNKSPSI